METTVQPYIVQPVAAPMLPVVPATLDDAVAVDASYSTSSQQLNVLVTFKLPGNVNPSQVTVTQYYNASDVSKLHFYLSYYCESPGNLKTYTGGFKASPFDAAGLPIALGSVLTITTMMMNSCGPKSSRGISSTVRTTED